MKYKLTEEIKRVGGITLSRIYALKDFSNVKAGDLGGWVESEDNLSQYGNCWVYDNASVFGYASVFGDAVVYGDAKVSGNARVSGDARVCGDARVSSRKHFIVIESIGSEDGTLTAFTQKDNSIGINRGCFSGTIDEFEKRVKETHGNNTHAQIYLALIPIIKMRLQQVA